MAPSATPRQLPRRDRECPSPSAASIVFTIAQPRKVQAEPADGAEQGHHQRLAAHHRRSCRRLCPAGAAQLAGALVDRQRQRVGDAHEGDHDGHDQQHVDDGQHLVDLAGDGVDVLLAVLHVGRPEPVGDRLDGGLPVGGRDTVDQVDEARRRSTAPAPWVGATFRTTSSTSSSLPKIAPTVSSSVVGPSRTPAPVAEGEAVVEA